MFQTQPALLLRVEGAMLLVATTAFYWREDNSWLLFAIAFFLPDLSMLGYTARPRTGATVYNLAHTSVLPLVLVLGGVVADQPLVTALALIWLAHIGFDRLLGYGLKYPEGFKETHLSRV